jgi:hypothetical protein
MNARVQGNAAGRIEWAIFVLGLAGIAAIFVPFFLGLSPLAAVPVLLVLGSSVAALDVFTKIASTTAVLVFFLAPLLSYSQLSRCLRRPISRWERGVLRASAAVVTAGCLSLVACFVFMLIVSEWGGARDVVNVSGAMVVWVILLWWVRRAQRRHRGMAAEPLAQAAYIGGVATWAVLFSSDLEPTAVVAGFTCVVYAVSVWRRNGEGKA